jgi:hypothetical protein
MTSRADDRADCREIGLIVCRRPGTGIARFWRVQRCFSVEDVVRRRLSELILAALLVFGLWPASLVQARQGHVHVSGGVAVGGGYGHVHVGVGVGYYGGYYGFYPWFYWGPYSPYWYPWGYPGYPWYGYGYPYYPQSSVRIEVTPREAKVFVDGYFAGTVDDYDGTFQRLHVTPGKHDILIYLEGYHSLKQSFYLSPDSTYKIKGEMAKLAPGDPPEPLPPAPPPPQQRQDQGGPPPDQNEVPPLGVGAPPPTGIQAQPGGYPPESSNAPPPAPPNTRFGRVLVRAQPVDAEIYIDGERWLTPDSADRLVVNLAAGRHHIEIHKMGFDSFSTEIDVRPGESTPINVSLPPHDRSSAQ